MRLQNASFEQGIKFGGALLILILLFREFVNEKTIKSVNNGKQ